MTDSRKRLEKIASGFMPARVLLTAAELDVFSQIGEETLTAGEIARRTGARPEPLERLLNALVALKILRKQKGRYHNSREALRHLASDEVDFLGDIMQHRASMWETWSHLTEIVRTGKVPPRPLTRERERRFIKGMANVGAFSAAETARTLKRELAPAKRLLDLGGGPAVYACEFARRKAGLRVTVLDLPGPLRYARETIQQRGMSGQVTCRAADVLKVSSFGRGYDVAFLSNFIHVFKRPEARAVMEKAARALKKGGHLAVKEFYIEKNRTAPPFAALFSINMLVADAGDCYSLEEVTEWMAQAGVRAVRFVEVAEFSGILVGRRV